MNKNCIKKIKAIVGEKYLTTAPEDLMCYSYDGTGMEHMPSAVAFPGSASEISAIMELANLELFPVIPRGAGTAVDRCIRSVGIGVARARKCLGR